LAAALAAALQHREEGDLWKTMVFQRRVMRRWRNNDVSNHPISLDNSNQCLRPVSMQCGCE
jgi:hypothetical protein